MPKIAKKWLFDDENGKACKRSHLYNIFKAKSLDYCNLRKILILLWNWKAWLRSQAFNMGNVG